VDVAAVAPNPPTELEERLHDAMQVYSEAMPSRYDDYDRAARAYDTAEPADPPPCNTCDGTRRVEVASVLNVDGREVWWPNGFAPVEVACPFCA
jgi:hypothetical protein